VRKSKSRDQEVLTSPTGPASPQSCLQREDCARTCRGALLGRMTQTDEQRTLANLVKIMAMLCVRNSRLEDLHAGLVPVTHTGDYSDVFVVDADGRRIPWPDVSRINDDEMRALMRDIVNRLYTFHVCADAPALQAQIARWMAVASRWDEPEIDGKMLGRGSEPR
jgi:hypothetical protein